MTVTLFISLFAGGSVLCGLITEAIKAAYKNAGKDYSANIIALIDALAVGGLGTATAYMLMSIPWTVNNIICLCLMCVMIWLGAMVGFDKVLQTIGQITNLPKKTDKAEDESDAHETNS